MGVMQQVIRLQTDPAPFLDNDAFWSDLGPDQKQELLVDGAKSEIDKVLSLFAAHKLDKEETRELVLRLAKVAIQD